MTCGAPIKLGFVVIGRNEGSRLEACLQSLLPIGAPIAYADSGSNDGSAELAQRLGATVVRLNPARPMNASRGRREGYLKLAAKYGSPEFVQFIDGDCLLVHGWIEQAISFMQDNPKAAAVCGRRFEARPDASFYNKLCDAEWNTPCGAVNSLGGDSLMRAAALEQAGNFDPSLMASEEPELAARLREAGWKIWRIDLPMTEHDANIFSFKAYWRRSLRAGFGYAQAWRKTAGLKTRINSRLLASSLFWTVIVPILVLVSAVIARSFGAMLMLPLIYVFQIGRMAARKNIADASEWRAAAVTLAVKSAELLGAARAIFGEDGRSAISYKGV